MRLFPLTPVFASRLRGKLRKVSKRLIYNIAKERVKPELLIILGDGDPDDLVASIICHHFDGERVAGIVKPESTRVSALKHLPTHLSTLKTINTIIEVLDQEDDELDALYERVEKMLRDLNIRYSLESDPAELRRVRLYECLFGSRRFSLVIIVSGLDDVMTESHSIEDHLCKAAVELGELQGENTEINTKNRWKSLSKETQFGVLRGVLDNRSFAQRLFPQHFEGFALLRELQS